MRTSNTLMRILVFCLLAHSVAAQQISRGDVLEIMDYNRPELTKTVIVQEDGTIDYPFVSNIPIDAFTLDELRELLTAQAGRYTDDVPIISVRFATRMFVQVVILGQVIRPGDYLISKNATLQGALVQAGGATPLAELDRIKLIRKRDGNTDTLVVDLLAFARKGDPGLLPALEEGDMVFVPGMPGTSDVKVIGEVKAPGNIAMQPGTNLLDALFMAGGPTRDAELSGIRIYSTRRGQGEERRVDLKQCMDRGAFTSLPAVGPGDVIIVDPKSKTGTHILNGIRTVTTLVTPIIMILYYSGVIDRK